MLKVRSVFVSSTSEDLKEYRAAAEEAVKRAELQPRMMEYFAAKGGPPLKTCLEKVAPCDAVVVIVAHRYGWVPPDQVAKQAKSITWLECEHAAKAGKPLLVFLLDPKVKWPAERKEAYRLQEAMEEGKWKPELAGEVQRNMGKLAEFKQWLDKRQTRATFTTPDDLKAKVLQALYQWQGRAPEGDPRKYLDWLREQCATIDIRGLSSSSGKAHSFPIRELYIPLTTAAAARRRGQERMVPEPVELQDALRNRRLVIAGDPGAGKTTFLRRIAFELASGSGEFLRLGRKEHPLPIFIRIDELATHLRNCAGRKDYEGPTVESDPTWFADYLYRRSESQGWGLERGYFEKKLKEGGALLLLDGLDEAPDRVERERIARLFEAATQAYKDCRFVVTTRPQAYRDRATLAGFHSVNIEPLRQADIESFLERWCGALFPKSARRAQEHLKGLSGALRAKPEIRRMSSNPVMLTALAVVHWNDKRLPEQRAELYESIVTWLSRSREMRPGREKPERCVALLQELALSMQSHPDGRQKGVSLAWAADALAPEFEVRENERVPKAAAFLTNETADSGIVVTRGASVAFAHLTFQEFLAARAVKDRPDKAQYDLLLKRGAVFTPEWREVVLLMAGLYGKGGRFKVDALVSKILDTLGPSPTLAERARCVGLVGAIAADLAPFEYAPSDPRYASELKAVLGIFDKETAESVPFQDRLEAAEALGKAGDPRLTKDQWVKIRRGKSKGFEMGKYPVTVYEYEKFVEAGGYQDRRWWKEGGFDNKWTAPDEWEEQRQHPNWPVTRVSWYESKAYCAWKEVRLPTSDEWGWAASGKEARTYPWGTETPDETRANRDLRVGHVTPVGLFPNGATPEGLLDMAGNVWEWVEDWYEDSKTTRVLRGGSWYSIEVDLGAGFRARFGPEFRVNEIGFRCARNAV